MYLWTLEMDHDSTTCSLRAQLMTGVLLRQFAVQSAFSMSGLSLIHRPLHVDKSRGCIHIDVPSPPAPAAIYNVHLFIDNTSHLVRVGRRLCVPCRSRPTICRMTPAVVTAPAATAVNVRACRHTGRHVGPTLSVSGHVDGRHLTGRQSDPTAGVESRIKYCHISQ